MSTKANSFFSVRGCILLFFLLILILGLSAGALLAKTGLVNIPLLSQVFYHPPQPSRQLNLAGNDISRDRVFASKIAAGKSEVEISETEATAMLASFAAGRNLKISELQIVFLPDAAEFYFKLPQKRPTPVKILARPSYLDGHLDLSLAKIELGSLKIPVFALNLLMETVLRDKINGLEKLLQSLSLKSFSLADRQLILRFGDMSD